jgi:ankyrin repeat protein
MLETYHNAWVWAFDESDFLQFGSVIRKYALFEYAGRYWHFHARKAKIFSNSIEDILNNLILEKEKHGADLFSFVKKICLYFPTMYSDLRLVEEMIKDVKLFLHQFIVYFGLENTLRFFVEHFKVDINMRASCGRTLLAMAAKTGHTASLRYLLKQEEIAVDTIDEFIRAPILYAAQNGDVETMKLLFDRGDIEVNRKDDEARTPLSYAAESDQIGTKLLLDHTGIDPDATDIDNRSPLFHAAEEGHTEALELLLRRNVQLNLKDNNNGRTALNTAAAKGHTEAIKLLIKHDGVDINSQDDWGYSPLYFLSQNGDMETIKLLLEDDKVDINLRADDFSPLALAVYDKHTAFVDLLLERGADLESKDESGRTALSRSVEWEDQNVFVYSSKKARMLIPKIFGAIHR